MTRKLVKEMGREEEQQEMDQNIITSVDQRAEREEEELKEDMSGINETDGFENIRSGDFPAEPQHGIPQVPPPVLIAVMGKTGTGKTSFINAFTGGGLTVGHGLESCTQHIQTSSATINGREVWLIDTPGFDDTSRSDVDILATIAEWVKQASHERKHLSGIIYFHRIVDPRMEGSNMKNLKMFRELCGEKNFNNVILLTTMWDKVSEEEGQRREQELQSREGFWGSLISRGAQVKQHRGPDFAASARRVAEPLIEKDTIVLQLQEELGSSSSLSDTSAGKLLTGEIEEVKKKHQEEMEDLKAEMKANDNKEEIKLLKECYQQEIKGLKKVTDDLEKLRVDDERKFKRRMDEMKNQWHHHHPPPPPPPPPVCIIN